MNEARKDAIAALLVERDGITLEEAEDIVAETQYQVNDVLAGESAYKSAAEVLHEFLDLGESYVPLFLYNDEPPVTTEIPGFEGTLEQLNNLSL